MTPVCRCDEPPDQRVQRGHLGVVERRRRLVHDQHAGVVGQRLGDLDHLLLGDGQGADHVLRVQRELQPVDQFGSLTVLFPVVQEEAAATWLPADEDVLRDGEIGHQVELLMDDADPGLLGMFGPADLVALAVEVELALIGGVDPGEQLHQRRLAGAVLADQGEHLAAVQVQVHVLQGLHAGKALRHPAHFQQWSSRGHRVRGHRCRRLGHPTLPSPVVATTPLRSTALP